MYAISKICLLLLTVIQLFFITACSGIPPCQKLEKNGMSYGWSEGNFMGDWDDYYQCALSYIEGEFYPEALECLDKAINRRDKDRRMARSYGLHFVENYFPHREKGWVYYVTDKYEEALFELNTSIQHEPSDKAYKIRDKVLIQMMKRKIMAQKLSVKNPDLSLQFPSQKPKTSYVMTKDKIKNSYTVWTKDDFFTLSGIATDRLQYISEIVTKDNQVFPTGKRLFLEHSSKDPVEFEEHFKLNQGKYR
ncbi:MAG: hypothetical protein KAI81_03700, partial [Candidatus Marinimicrobia bacterium]|nr:hypothetical protein [Candidatus Neomarinimicrobiota bacterium]